MAKYSYEFKMKVVEAYLNNEGGYSFLSDKYGMSDTKNIRTWVAAYKKFGAGGLMRSRKNETYTFEFKLHVVELYLSTEVQKHSMLVLMSLYKSKSVEGTLDDFIIAIDLWIKYISNVLKLK